MSEPTTALVPIQEQKVDFYGDDITAALAEVNGKEQVLVPIRPLCEFLGLNWTGQNQRIKRDLVLSKIQTVCVMHTVLGPREMICLPLDFLNGWLFGIDAGRVKDELRDKVLRYQMECYRVLAEHFQKEIYRPSTSTSGLAQIRDMGLAIAQMAEQQMEMERNVTRAHSRLDQAALAFKALDQRVTGIERKLTPGTLITDEQASEVSQAVKALADYLKSKDVSKNHYQAVFSELYRRFSVSSYKNIRADQYAAVLKFLEDWKATGK